MLIKRGREGGRIHLVVNTFVSVKMSSCNHAMDIPVQKLQLIFRLSARFLEITKKTNLFFTYPKIITLSCHSCSLLHFLDWIIMSQGLKLENTMDYTDIDHDTFLFNSFLYHNYMAVTSSLWSLLTCIPREIWYEIWIVITWYASVSSFIYHMYHIYLLWL